MWKAVFTVLGAVVGPVTGYFSAYYLVFLRMAGDCYRRPFSQMAGLFLGVPTGAILFCLLGFCVGSVLDGRSRATILIAQRHNQEEKKEE